MIKPLQKGADSRKNWTTINQLIEAGGYAAQDARSDRAARADAARRAGIVGRWRHPFEIYLVPLSQLPPGCSYGSTFAVRLGICESRPYLYSNSGPIGGEVYPGSDNLYPGTASGPMPQDVVDVPSVGDADPMSIAQIYDSPTHACVFRTEAPADQLDIDTFDFAVGFWVELREKDDESYTQINARMFNGQPSQGIGELGRPLTPYPESGVIADGERRTVYPIGYYRRQVDAAGRLLGLDQGVLVQQRHESIRDASGLRFRGDFVADDLSGAYFVDGDIVTVGYGSGEVHSYVHTGSSYESATPDSDSDSWRMLS